MVVCVGADCGCSFEMKVFILAFACEPNRTSEPGVGWNVVGELAKHHELTVLTRCNNRKPIEDFLALNRDDPRHKIEWEYIDLPEWFHWLKKRMPCGIQLYQELWQLKAARTYRSVYKNYDIVHHLTFGSIFFTPWAAKYADRFLWGPIGGASGAMEDAFLKNERLRSRITEFFYRFVAWYSFHPLPWARRCREACGAILYRTSELAEHVVRYPNQFFEIRGEAAYPGKIEPRNYEGGSHPLRVMSVGRLIPLKGVKYTIAGFLDFLKGGGKGELHIYGDGPLRKELEALAAKSIFGSMIHFHGNVPNEKVIQALSISDVLVHASFREGVSWTILEAMAQGLPVVCQNRAGMKDLVVDGCGERISAATPAALREEIANALHKFYAHPDLLRVCGTAAQSRVASEYTWQGIAEVIEKVYAKLHR